MNKPKCEVYHTSVPRNRKSQEDNLDAVFADPDAYEIAVCDGMSSQELSKLASRRVALTMGDPLARSLRDQPDVVEMERGLERLFNLFALEVEFLSIIYDIRVSIGTTCVFAKLWVPKSATEPLLTHAHLGDSRLYRRRGDSFECCTLDHSPIIQYLHRRLHWTLEELLLKQRTIDGFSSKQELGDFLTACAIKPKVIDLLITRRHALANLINNKPADRTPPRIDHFLAHVGDEYFVVTDGVSRNVPPDRFQQLACRDIPLRQKCDLIVQEALDNADKATSALLWGGRDDTTIVGMRVVD